MTTPPESLISREEPDGMDTPARAERLGERRQRPRIADAKSLPGTW
jgi:hypothetical protein